MKTVALYGFASVSREGIWNTKADEIWSIAWAYKYNVPRLDRILEIHPIWMQAKSQKPEYVKPREHWEWLKNNQTIPIYMLIQHPEVPKSIRYPIEKVWELIPPSRRRSVFTSSFDFLMGMAISEGFERIELYGFEMGSDTEYRYQREGASYWISQADARGIEVVLPENTALLKKKMYGYEGGSMIYRQDLERINDSWAQQKVDAVGRVTYLEGRLAEAILTHGLESKEAKALQEEFERSYRMSLIIEGYERAVKYLLAEIDLEEPKEDFVDTTRLIPFEQVKNE